MKKKIYWQVLTLLCLIPLLISGYAFEDDSPVYIDKISVHPEKLNTKIKLESDIPLPAPRSYYAKDAPATMVVELEKIRTDIFPKIIQQDASSVEDIEIKTQGISSARLLIRLQERVPYRIYSEGKTTVVELHTYQRNMENYSLEREKVEELGKKSERTIFLKKINVSKKSHRIDVLAKLSEKVVTQVFALDDPPRLVVDLFDTLYSDSHAVFPVNKLGLEKVRASQFQISNPHTITRIVFDLSEPTAFTLNTEDNGLIISFLDNKPALPTASSEPQPAQIQAQEPQLPEEEIDTSEKKESSPPLEGRAETLPEPDPDVKAEATPAASPKKEEETPSSDEEDGALQERVREEQFTPKTITAPEEKYTGKILSLKFKDADLRDVILYLGEFAGLNVVFDPEVRGTVTVDLKDVPWDQALDIILKINKMGKTLEGNILRIAPVGVLTREEEEQRRLSETKELAGPILVKTFTLSYSKASDVQTLLRNKLSERGEIIVDGRTNTLIVSDVEERIDLIEKLISVFDTPTPQVSIEARIVEATSNFVRNLGIQWGFRGIADPFYGNQTSLQFPHKALVDGALIPQGIVTKGIGGPLGGYAVNLPAPAFNTAIGLSFANIMDTFRLDMAISALETSGEGRIISAPKVTTQNNQEAEILQGRQIPVQTVANFTVTTRYVNAALELKATPQITAEGTIIMYIEIRNNAADFANLVNGIPPIITQSARTTVMVPDGGTTVIGGIYRTEDSITRERVPFFHKIPILGNLFKSFARTKQNRELLIFITPRIIK
jgi:type IV pilus assembly protein PilQ